MRTLLWVIALTLVLPLPAHAYLTPEDVLMEEDYVTPPPNARGAKAARAAQEAEYDARSSSSAADDALHPAADDAPLPESESVPEELSPDALRNARILERVEQHRLDQGSREVTLRGSAPAEPLHGGAPLAPTGMGTIVAMLAIGVAVGMTVKRAARG